MGNGRVSVGGGIWESGEEAGDGGEKELVREEVDRGGGRPKIVSGDIGTEP
jgi:hypothetical protein